MDTIYTVMYIYSLSLCSSVTLNNQSITTSSDAVLLDSQCPTCVSQQQLKQKHSAFGIFTRLRHRIDEWLPLCITQSQETFFFFLFKCSCRLFLATVIYLSSPQLCSSVHHSNTQFLMRYQRWPRGHTAAASGLGPTRAPLTPWFFPHFFNCKRWQGLQSSCHAKWISPEFPIHS